MNDFNMTASMDEMGIYALEYILIVGFGVLISASVFYCIYDINELNTCMAAARNGATEGAFMDSLAIYPIDKYEYYTKRYPRLKSGSKVVIHEIRYENQGFNPVYNRTKIQLQVVASAPSIKYPEERNCLGDRINYYTRKAICECYKTENITNIYFNPAFSERYFFTTQEVQWV